jgi:hypothetical protein
VFIDGTPGRSYYPHLLSLCSLGPSHFIPRYHLCVQDSIALDYLVPTGCYKEDLYRVFFIIFFNVPFPPSPILVMKILGTSTQPSRGMDPNHGWRKTVHNVLSKRWLDLRTPSASRPMDLGRETAASPEH